MLPGADLSQLDAIVTQGGGMRSSFGAGALTALSDRSVTARRYYGSSAGAVNAAYFATGQAEDLRTLYADLMQRPGIVNKWRPWKIVDLERLHETAAREIPLRPPPGGIPLTVSVVDAADGSCEYVDLAGRSVSDVYAWLLATSAIPILFGKRVEVDGRRWVDGSVVDSVPLFRAMEDGNQNILVVASRPLTHRRPRNPLPQRWAKRLLSLRSGLATASLLGREDPLYNRTMALLESPPPSVTVVSPTNPVVVGASNTSMDALNRMWAAGYAEAAGLFDEPPSRR